MNIQRRWKAGMLVCLTGIVFFALRMNGIAADEQSEQPSRYALLFAKSIQDANAPPMFGISISNLQWWLVDADSAKMRKVNLDAAKRASVRPIGQTITLNRESDKLDLLGPDGAVLTLSLAKGPLAAAKVHDEGQRTTFGFSPNGKHLVFANAAGAICSIDLKSQRLTVTKLTGVNQADGVRFNRQGTKITYSKYTRVDNFSRGAHNVYVANADFSGEKKVTQFIDGMKLGFGFLPDGRIGVVGPKAVEAYSPASSKSEVVAKWEKPIRFRQFGGFSPDGSSFMYDLGGPYVLRMFSFDLKSKKPTVVGTEYFESFQPLVWVRLESKP